MSDKDRAGIGWKLVNASGSSVMLGSASTDPIATPFEAEAYAMRDAVKQVKSHGYTVSLSLVILRLFTVQ